MSYYNLQNLKKYIYWEGLGQNLWSQCGSAAPALAPALDVDVDQGRREGGQVPPLDFQIFLTDMT